MHAITSTYQNADIFRTEIAGKVTHANSFTKTLKASQKAKAKAKIKAKAKAKARRAKAKAKAKAKANRP